MLQLLTSKHVKRCAHEEGSLSGLRFSWRPTPLVNLPDFDLQAESTMRLRKVRAPKGHAGILGRETSEFISVSLKCLHDWFFSLFELLSVYIPSANSSHLCTLNPERASPAVTKNYVP